MSKENSNKNPIKISLALYSILFFIFLIVILEIDNYSSIIGVNFNYMMVYMYYCILGIMGILTIYGIAKRKMIRTICCIIVIVLSIPVFTYIYKDKYVYSSGITQLAKPIIYLYPEKETNINVSFRNSSCLTCTYPKYDENKGWNVVADPNGDLKYEDKDLYALYWEGNSKTKKEIKEDGFVVKGEDTAKFLEEKLYILGLSDREAEEFIVYWLPRMEKNEYNYIRFETMEEIDDNMPLEINPKPDTTIRVMMDWSKINDENEAERLKNSIIEQEFPQVERKGYVAVEWGGSEIK